MKKYGITILFIYLVISGFHLGEIPQAEISNGILKANIYLPDIKNGYHRGTRFDWSGIISSLEYKGHNYYGKWLDKYSPTSHNSVIGPADYFDPINYHETGPEKSFVKVGVGSLERRRKGPYNSFRSYPVINEGEWKVVLDEAKIRFHHTLNDENYPYEYSKTIEFVEGEPIMVISYCLKNIGKNIIETQTFNHNFFVFDNQVVGEGFELTFTKNISCVNPGRGIGDIAEIEANKLKILRRLGKGESVYCGSLTGINGNAEDYDIHIDNRHAGTGVRIKGDQPISKLVFWSNGKAICPEPYFKIRIEPGEEYHWERVYTFYAKDELSE